MVFCYAGPNLAALAQEPASAAAIAILLQAGLIVSIMIKEKSADG
jgi:hypothetical protein